MAVITDRNIAHRVMSRSGEVAVPAMPGIRNRGAGPGLGPTA